MYVEQIAYIANFEIHASERTDKIYNIANQTEAINTLKY